MNQCKIMLFTIGFAFLLQPITYAQENALPDADVAEAMMLFGGKVVAKHGSDEARAVIEELAEAGVVSGPISDSTIRSNRYHAIRLFGDGMGILASLFLGYPLVNHMVHRANVAEMGYRIGLDSPTENFRQMQARMDRSPGVGSQAAKRAWEKINRFMAMGLSKHIDPLYNSTVAAMDGVRRAENKLRLLKEHVHVVIDMGELGQIPIENQHIDLADTVVTFEDDLERQRKELQAAAKEHMKVESTAADDGVLVDTPESLAAKAELSSFEDALGQLSGYDSSLPTASDRSTHLLRSLMDFEADLQPEEFVAKFEAAAISWIDDHSKSLENQITSYKRLIERLGEIQKPLKRVVKVSESGNGYLHAEGTGIRNNNATRGYASLDTLSRRIEETKRYTVFEGYAVLNDLQSAVENVRKQIDRVTAISSGSSHETNAIGELDDFEHKLATARGTRPIISSTNWRAGGIGALLVLDIYLAVDFLYRLAAITTGNYQGAADEAKTAEDFMQQYARQTLAPLMGEEEVDESYDIATEFYYDHFQPLLAAIHYEAFPELYEVRGGDAS